MQHTCTAVFPMTILFVMVKLSVTMNNAPPALRVAANGIVRVLKVVECSRQPQRWLTDQF
jgi:hypothetical protein